MLTTLYGYFEKAKEAAIAANDRDAINCFTWIVEALNTESYKKRTVYPDVPADEAAKTFAKATHELASDCLIIRGVEVGMRENAPSETLEEAVYLALKPKLISRYYVYSIDDWRCSYHTPFQGDYPESVSTFMRSLVKKTHDIEAEERRLIKSAKRLKPTKDIEDFGYNPQEVITDIEVQGLVDRISCRLSSYGF